MFPQEYAEKTEMHPIPPFSPLMGYIDRDRRVTKKSKMHPIPLFSPLMGYNKSDVID